MRKPRAIAITVSRHPLHLAANSAHNFGLLMLDFMYGTQQRANMTYIFAIGLALIGLALSAHGANGMSSCAV